MGNVHGALGDNQSKLKNTTKLRHSLQVKSRALAKFLTSAHRKGNENGTIYDNGSSRGSSLKDDIDNIDIDSETDDVDGDFASVLLIKTFDNEDVDEVIGNENDVKLLNDNVNVKRNIVHAKTSTGYVENIVSGKWKILLLFIE